MSTPAIEHKVTAATLGAYLAGVVGLAVVTVASSKPVIGLLPTWLGVVVVPLLPAVVALVSGYATKHTPRGVVAQAIDAATVGKHVDPLKGP